MSSTKVVVFVFTLFLACSLKAQEADSLLYSNTSLTELLTVVKKAKLDFDLPDNSFYRTEDPRVFVSKKWESKISYRVTPIGFSKMIPTFQEKYVISSDRELMGQEKHTFHRRKGFVSKFKEFQKDGQHYILWVIIFGDDKITYSASASYPEQYDTQLEDHYFKMMKEVGLRFN